MKFIQQVLVFSIWLNSETNALEAYQGPVLRHRVEVSIEDPRGFVLEVAESTIRGAGRGLYVRALDEDVLIKKDEVLCGYAQGSIDHGASREEAMASGYAFEMSFTGDQQKVVYNNSVQRVVDLTAFADIDTNSAIFLPDTHQTDLVLDNLGHLANDLAWNGPETSYTEYRERSQATNLLGILGQLDEKTAHTGERPLLAFSKPVIVAYTDFLLTGKEKENLSPQPNDNSTIRRQRSLFPPGLPRLPAIFSSSFSSPSAMEIGIEYGWYYWQ